MMQFRLKHFLLGALIASAPQLAEAQCGDRYNLPIFEDITVTDNVQYGSNVAIGGANTTLKFDFYEPTGDEMEKRPLIIWAHGGTFIGGTENEQDIVDMCEEFTKRGYVNASINYRLLPIAEATGALLGGGDIQGLFFDEVVKSVSDMWAAIRFFRQDAANENIYRVDPEQIYIGGASAGGILSVHAAYLNEDADFADYDVLDAIPYITDNGGWEGNSGNDGYSKEVSGVINLCGAIGSATFLREGDVPIVSIHGNSDTTVPYGVGTANALGFPIIEMEGSSVIQERMDELGIYNDLMTLEGQNHMAHASASNFPNSVTFISDFLYPLIVCEDTNVGIESNSIVDKTQLRVYPNPSNGMVSLELGDSFVDYAQLKIFDAMGRLITNQKISGRFIQFDGSNLNSGLYEFVLESGIERISKRVVFN